ncbi:MAG: CDP-alcohol phosphatidyltransferase family protein, partial [Flavobacteriales bacterium]
PILLLLIWFNRLAVFKWLLGICFFTDAIDGILARKLKVASVFGTKLDSIGDDLTILAGILGVWFFKKGFLYEQRWFIGTMLILFALQTLLAFLRYGRITSFHTLLAKLAAILQGSFLILLFFTSDPFLPLFYTAAFITTLELIEEIILVLLLKEWHTNVKGIYWVMKAAMR